jgi:Icc-related predicted phosphoesterase
MVAVRHSSTWILHSGSAKSGTRLRQAEICTIRKVESIIGLEKRSHLTEYRVQSSKQTIRVVCISDTHELHRELDIPPGDILIHAGDFTLFGKRPSQVSDFNDWLGELPHAVKIVVPGNHEFLIEADDQASRLLSNAVLLINSGVEADGLKIWGSPVTNLRGAFGLKAEARLRIFESIPGDTDVLVTHAPPLGILDCETSTLHSGCPLLREIVTEIKPRLHVFGHIHRSYGHTKIGPTTFLNVSMLAKDGLLTRTPYVIDLEVNSPSTRR